jgi:hypothetical protein
MEQTHENREGGIASYEVVGNPHPIQARKAWEDNETWMAGRLLAYEDRVATVVFGDGDVPARESGLWLGGPVWVTKRWRVLAFADEEGNAIALRPLEEMSDSIYGRIGHERLRFVSIRLVDEHQGGSQPSTDPLQEELDPDKDLVYTTLVGFDDIDRFLVAPRAFMDYVCSIVTVATSCTTWGEVRETATPEVYGEFLARSGYGSLTEYLDHVGEGRLIRGHEAAAMDEYMERAHEELPADDEPFLIDELDGYMVADFPPSVSLIQNQVLPRDIVEEYGATYETTLNGTYTDLLAEHADEILAALRERGYRCEEDRDVFVTEMFRFEDLPNEH